MFVSSTKKLLSVALLFLALPACKTLSAETTMPSGISVPAHRGFQEFCARSPEECVLPYTSDMRQLIISLHNTTKDLVLPTEETGDIWRVVAGPGPGDCEDFALTLRKLLREELPEYAGAFRLATAYTEAMQYHAVLTIETSAGTMVCDIRFAQCGAWEAFPYKWHLREVVGSESWQSLADQETLAALFAASIAASSGR